MSGPHQKEGLPKTPPKHLAVCELIFAGTVPVYRGIHSRLDWFTTFENILENSVGDFEIPARMLCYGPGMAQQWLRNAGQRTQHLQQRDAFHQFLGASLADILSTGQQSNALCLVALGAGDFKKVRCLLDGIFYSRPQQTIQFIPYDISFDMMSDSLAEVQRAGLADAITRANGQILGINDEFSRLPDYRHLMTLAHTRFFCLLGNTLGNEHEERTLLEPIYSCMSGEDRLLVEVQLVEENPPPTESVQAAIQNDKEFLAGPFVVCGVPTNDIDLELTKQEAFLSDGSHYANLYKVTCRFKSGTTLVHPILTKAYEMPKGRNVQTLLVKKYKADALCSLFSQLGFRLVCKPVTIETENRLFGYFCLARESGTERP